MNNTKKTSRKKTVTSITECDERIPVIRVAHWMDFVHQIEDGKILSMPVEDYVFRGHRKFSWKLTPTLARYVSNDILTEEICNTQLEAFRKSIRGRIQDYSLVEEDEKEELWAIGQHYGLHTPLLDWTYSPYVALFFAFLKPNKDGSREDRSIYILNRRILEKSDNSILFEPKKDQHGRLVNQSGLFTISPYATTLESKIIEIIINENSDISPEDESKIISKYILKVGIKDKEQKKCLTYLRRMNIHHASLFPDIIGAAEYCNSLIELSKAAPEKAQSTIERIPEKQLSMSPYNFNINVMSTPAGKLKYGRKLSLFLHKNLSNIEYKIMLKEIASLLNRYMKVIDWYKRNDILAEYRLSLRLLFKRKGLPVEQIEEFAQDLLDINIPTQKNDRKK